MNDLDSLHAERRRLRHAYALWALTGFLGAHRIYCRRPGGFVQAGLAIGGVLTVLGVGNMRFDTFFGPRLGDLDHPRRSGRGVHRGPVGALRRFPDPEVDPPTQSVNPQEEPTMKVKANVRLVEGILLLATLLTTGPATAQETINLPGEDR